MKDANEFFLYIFDDIADKNVVRDLLNYARVDVGEITYENSL